MKCSPFIRRVDRNKPPPSILRKRKRAQTKKSKQNELSKTRSSTSRAATRRRLEMDYPQSTTIPVIHPPTSPDTGNLTLLTMQKTISKTGYLYTRAEKLLVKSFNKNGTDLNHKE